MSVERSVSNFARAVVRLEMACNAPILDFLDLAGTTKHFELAYETGYKALLSVFVQDDPTILRSAKAVFTRAYHSGLVSDEQAFLAMVEDRNLSAHTYDDDVATALVERIKTYMPLLKSLAERLESKVL